MITVHRICESCGRTFSQVWEAGVVLVSLCPSCQNGKHAH